MMDLAMALLAALDLPELGGLLEAGFRLYGEPGVGESLEAGLRISP